MAAPNLDPINTAATKKIMPGVADNFFKNDPLMAFMKRRYQTWDGFQIQENFLFKPMRGGAYQKGGTFDTNKRQTIAGLLFSPKYYYVNVTEYIEEIEVEVHGDTAVLSLVKTDLGNAALTMSAILAIDFYNHGQDTTGGGSSVNRTPNLNGLDEMLADGTNNTWTGDAFATYGSQTRADVGAAIKSPSGLVAANIAGTISFKVLEHTYLSCVIGEEHPVVGITTNRCLGFLSENFQPHQIVDTVEPEIGYTGLKFKKATIVESQYAPGQDGVNDADLGNYNNGNETFWWLNPGPAGEDAYIKLRIAASQKFQFGFTGFKPGRDDTKVSGQILFGGNSTCRSPRLSRGLFGITG